MKPQRNGPQEPWHGCSADAVLDTLATSRSGLGREEVERRRAKFGLNVLPEPPRASAFRRFLLQFHNILIYVLLGAAALTLALGHLTDTAVIVAVVLVNACIGFVQEGKAEKALEAIRDMLAPHATVLRGAERLSIDGVQLVPGDVVVLEAGDRVPADLRLFQTAGLQAQEAILTGESVPVEKQTQEVAATAVLGDRTCMAFSGTLVTSGTGRGVVVATGADTEIGRISGLLSEVGELQTPLLQQMDRFSRLLTFVILGVAAVLLAHGWFLGRYPFADLFMAVVGLSVAAIPEGLPAVLTITLAVGVRAMARRNAIVRRLPAIETLGAVSVICTDKTGTLTRNEMVAVTVLTPEGEYAVSGEGYAPVGAVHRDGKVIDPEGDATFDLVGTVAALCNDAMLRQVDGLWHAEGDPMEAALVSLAEKLGRGRQALAGRWQRRDELPFDASWRYMATLLHDHDGHALIAVKGAPEQLIALCRYQCAAGGVQVPLEKGFWLEHAGAIASRGQRVLALAYKSAAPGSTAVSHEDLREGLVLAALVGLIDPPRPEAITAIAKCQGAGIAVKMITGDHRGTALAIGREIGLRNVGTALEGVDLDAMDDAALADAVMQTDVFARTNPEHKLRLVSALQAQGLTVAMTGDGVNDAPALKRADAGIAMGMKGSEVAKEASALVLADDNFASIVAAVQEGRTVYDNIKKVISWTLPTSSGEALIVTVALLMGLTLPITPIQILWVNLITAVTLGLALAFDPGEEGAMRRPPRPRNEPLLSPELVWHVVFVSLLFLAGVFGITSLASDSGYSLEATRTLAVNTLVVMEIFHLFFIRNMYGTTFSWRGLKATPVVWGTVVIVLCAQALLTWTAPMQQMFETTPLQGGDVAQVFGVGFALLCCIELEKRLRLMWFAARERREAAGSSDVS